MLSFIRKLQRKSPRTRKQIAFGASSAVTFLILLVWFSVTGGPFSTMNDEKRSQNAAVASPLSTFSDDLDSIISDLRTSIDDFRDDFEEGVSEIASSSEEASTTPRVVEDLSSRGDVPEMPAGSSTATTTP